MASDTSADKIRSLDRCADPLRTFICDAVRHALSFPASEHALGRLVLALGAAAVAPLQRIQGLRQHIDSLERQAQHAAPYRDAQPAPSA
jgi:hypothetical protein